MNDLNLRIAVPVLSEAPETAYRNYFVALLGCGVAVSAACDPEEFDGLLLPGGVDVDPARYHAQNVACGRLDPALDALQFEVLDAFVKAEKPVFGICRGHQLINVYFGGTLIQDVADGARHNWDREREADRVHGSSAESGSILAWLHGPAFSVNSAHHQAVERLGEGLQITQRAGDGVVEALEHERLPLFSVQWHPERMCHEHRRADTVDGSKVIGVFLDRCESHKKRR